MDFHQALLYFKYGSIFVFGIILGRISMAIQYAISKPKPKKAGNDAASTSLSLSSQTNQ
jgi:hypothetical protein